MKRPITARPGCIRVEPYQPEDKPAYSLTTLIEWCAEEVLRQLKKCALPPSPLALSEQQAAEVLGVDPSTLKSDRREAKRGGKLKVPYRKFGSRVIYAVDDLKAALDRMPFYEGGQANAA